MLASICFELGAKHYLVQQLLLMEQLFSDRAVKQQSSLSAACWHPEPCTHVFSQIRKEQVCGVRHQPLEWGKVEGKDGEVCYFCIFYPPRAVWRTGCEHRRGLWEWQWLVSDGGRRLLDLPAPTQRGTDWQSYLCVFLFVCVWVCVGVCVYVKVGVHQYVVRWRSTQMLSQITRSPPLHFRWSSLVSQIWTRRVMALSIQSHVALVLAVGKCEPPAGLHAAHKAELSSSVLMIFFCLTWGGWGRVGG